MRHHRLLITGGFLACLIPASLSLSWRWFHPPVGGPEPGDDVSLIQVDPEYPCGPVSVATVARLCGTQVELARVKQVVPVDSYLRTSMDDLIRGLQTLGLRAAGVRIGPSAVRRLGAARAILFIRQSHFAAALAAPDGSLVIVDPPQHTEVRRADDPALGWHGEAVIVCRTDDELAAALNRLGVRGH